LNARYRCFPVKPFHAFPPRRPPQLAALLTPNCFNLDALGLRSAAFSLIYHEYPANMGSEQRRLLRLTEHASFRGSLISQSEIKATVVPRDTRSTGHKMKRFLLLPAAVTLALTSPVPVKAGGGDVAAGLIGGLAAGTIIGAAVTAPRYYGPPPVYVGPAPYCYWTQGQPVWDPYRGAWMYPTVRVCQ
jgi:hypothetical protein